MPFPSESVGVVSISDPKLSDDDEPSARPSTSSFAFRISGETRVVFDPETSGVRVRFKKLRICAEAHAARRTKRLADRRQDHRTTSILEGNKPGSG